MSQIKREPLVYDDGRTKQSFKNQTDINKILQKAQKAGTISHLQKHGAFYGDFANFDFQEAAFALTRARSIFEELPSEIRKEFNQSPSEFFEYVNDPANADKLAEKLPALALPGIQRVAPLRTAETVAVEDRQAAEIAAVGGASGPEAAETTTPAPTPAGGVTEP